VILDQETWMDLRCFRFLHAKGGTYGDVGRECGCDWRNLKKHLAEDAPTVPPADPPRRHSAPQARPFESVIEAWLRT
jgi:hypothetical protein